MEQNKTKILSDLYAIRATMSVVAQNDDEAEKDRNAIWDLENEQSKADKTIRESENALGEKLYEKRKALQKPMEELQKKQEETRSSCERYKKYSNHSLKHYLWDTLWYHVDVGCLLGVILVILIVGGLASSFALGHIWSGIWGCDYDDWPAYFLGVLATGGICCGGIVLYLFGICVPAAIYQRKSDRDLLAYCEAKLQQSDYDLNKVTELYEAYSERINETTYDWRSKYRKIAAPKHHCAEVDGLVRSHESEVAQMEARKGELEAQKGPHKEAILAIAQRSQKIIESAVKAYPLIDFRDWENVDLIIYYFETGRADDMKEALQLVDRQRQTDQIVEAIENASESISKTIDRSMAQLGSALAQSFSVLSRQMAQQHVELMAGMERQAETQLHEIRAQTAEQRNAQAMNQALLKKISDSSLELAEQMDRQMNEAHGLY